MSLKFECCSRQQSPTENETLNHLVKQNEANKKPTSNPKSSFQTFPEARLYSRPLTCSTEQQLLKNKLFIKLCVYCRHSEQFALILVFV